ncbi:UPF0481 protein At3g47200-like [Hibiscus syriacus]|uniref:UPF0481 protein At3g47200-like n=1 Tax=Hibiscus syriacus TaxID=106335 RepID=UPI001920F240|nr:UPF0481 protein At3g47200-like [Hibiscus syriacus]
MPPIPTLVKQMLGRDTETSVREILDSKLGEVSTESKVKTMSLTLSFIFRAPRELRRVNEGAFEPQIISIGPYHHGKYHLKAMETLKVGYLSSLLQRCSDGLENCIVAYMSIEQEVRNCYAEHDDSAMSSAEFGGIMVVDLLFVVQLISKFMDPTLRESNDSLFKQNLNLSFVALDLLLLENQFPLCLLEKFADMTGMGGDTFARKALNFFSETDLRLRMLYKKRDDDFIYSAWCTIIGSSSTQFGDRAVRTRNQVPAGEENFLFDIQFKHGTLYIPTLIVDHDTERMMRNLIAYEQFKDKSGSIVMDYARFIDCLINYPADVALLCDCRVIDNRLGSNEDVASMINKINNYVKLRQTYFNTPWDWVLTSIAAATLLLVLAILQTIFSVLAYLKKKLQVDCSSCSRAFMSGSNHACTEIKGSNSYIFIPNTTQRIILLFVTMTRDQ